MAPPPSATANADMAYDPEVVHAMMAELEAARGNPFSRAVSALIVMGVASFVLFSVLTYSPFDTTADTAGLPNAKNIFGGAGAGFANIAMQSLGWGAILAALIALFSGGRAILRPKPYKNNWDRLGRISLCVFAVIFGAATLSAFPIPQDWPLATGMGGWFGDLIFLNLKALLLPFNIPFTGVIIAATTFTISVFCIGRFMRIVAKDLFDVVDAAGLIWAYVRVWIDRLAVFLARIFRRLFKTAYVDDVAMGAGADNVFRDMDTAQAAAPAPARPAQPVTPQHDYETPVVKPKPKPKAAPKAKRKPSLKPKKPQFNFPEGSEFVLPGLDLLKTPPPRSTVHDQAELARQSELLHKVMGDYGIEGDMGDVRPGPVVTLYEFEPAPGVKSQRVINLSDDIARNMSAQSARIAVVPGRNAMGVEMPNKRRETVWLKDMLASKTFRECEASLPLIMGEDIGGAPFVADLAKMPHLLVAGTTGSGKSVAINSMILSLMYTLTPEQCKFIMIDPKMLELSVYDNAPHLLAPVVTEPKKAVVALKWTVREMEDRYRKMSKIGVRNMAGFNEKVAEFKASGEVMTKTTMTGYNKETGEPEYETEELEFEPMPYIVVIIDEMADLMMVAKKDIEGSVQRLAQMARAAGIHMIMATQRPSVDVITGTIKANFPTRVSFRVGSKIDSRTILGEQGAEQLLGNGDMLYMGTGRPRRFHGPFVSDGEVERIADFVKAQGAPSYLEDITTEREEAPEDPKKAGGGSEGGSLFDQAVAIVARDRKASTSYIQRKLSIGYNRAADLVERMEGEGMIGPSGAGGKREIFLPEEDDPFN
jgi:S-DNA-T family DNA segregation ATPase FtsK/SpoIIIE